MAAQFLLVEEIQREESREEAEAGSRFDATHGRYLSLVSVINATPLGEGEENPVPFAWISAALRASLV